MEIVVNKCFGGFGLSPKAINEYLKQINKECYFYKENYKTHTFNKISLDEATSYDTVLTKDYGDEILDGWKTFDKDYFSYRDIERTDINLIKTIKKIGEKESSGTHSSLRIIEIPDDINYEIDEYDGIETVHEIHRSW